MKIRPLSKPLQQLAEKELNEVPSLIEINLQHIKDWLSKQEHLKSKNDDQLLVNFLRGSKYNLQRTKEKLDAYYTCRTIGAEICQNWDPFLPNMQASLNAGICLPLSIPESNPSSARSFIVRFGTYDPKVVTLPTMIKTAFIFISTFINIDDNAAVSGANVMIDFKGLQIRTIMQVTPTLLQLIIYCLDTALPGRLKAIHLLNIPKALAHILDLIKTLISDKLARRLHFHSSTYVNWESIYNDIPKSILPEEYGGYAGQHEQLAAKWKTTFEGYREWLIDETNYYSIESKRPGKPNTSESMFGQEDDQLILNFLRGSKYSLQRTKEKLEAFYTSRTMAADIAQNWDPYHPSIQSFLNEGIWVPLPIPQNNPTSERSFLVRFPSMDPEVVSLTTIFKTALIIVNICFNEDDHVVVCGASGIIDMKGLQFKTVTQATPTLVHRMVYCVDAALPGRLKALHFINVPRIAIHIFDMIKPLLSKKLLKRIYFHSAANIDWESIYNDVPKTILPKEYGGSAGTHEELSIEWKKTVENRREWLLKETDYRSIESKRPGKQNTIESVFGIQGSFRKLEID